ncbi:MAG: type II toxin-antitoxin system HicA family toxin [Gemmatimonadaceae bacterium]
MNANQQRTLTAIFARPVPQNIRWADVESLIRALGGTLEEREGSRVALKVKSMRAVFHRPHPTSDTDRNTVRDLRDLLESAGIQPSSRRPRHRKPNS